MQRKNPGTNNPWQNARIKPPGQRASSAQAPRPPREMQDESPRPPAAPRRGEEVRVYGRNACLALFARRAGDVRKVYLTEARIAEFKPVLAWCVKQRIGYRVVENDDLDRLTESQHHEGVCFEVRRTPLLSLRELLQGIPSKSPALLIWLDGVGNPHNVGALLRSAANFGARGAILPAATPALSGAALRVAEGGAEAVPLAQAQAGEDVFEALHEAGFAIAATVPRDGWDLYKNKLPDRLALILGAEGEGMSTQLIADADLRLTIPGTGAVESLNVSASAAVLFAEYWRQHR
jgi:TrmH RNA methyltransferase